MRRAGRAQRTAATVGPVEPAPVEAGAGERRPVGAAAGRIRGVEPLREEPGQARLARARLHRQEAAEAGLELWLADARSAVAALDALERADEAAVSEDLAQRHVGDRRAQVRRRAREEGERLRV